MNGLTFHPSRWAAYYWDEVLQAYPQAQSLVELGCDRINAQFEQFASEVFHRLYSDPDPIIPPRPECAWAQTLHDWLSSTEGWVELAWGAKGDPMLAGLATLTLAGRVLSAAKDNLPQAPDLGKPEQLRQQFHELAQTLADKPEQLQAQQAELRQQGQAAVQAAIAYAQVLQDSLSEMGRSKAVAVAEAAKEVKAAQSAIAAFAPGGAGKHDGKLGPGGDMATKVAIANRLASNYKLQQIMTLSGRMQTRARAKRKSKTRQSCQELVGVTQGRDLNRLLPTEIAKLASPEQRVQFAQGYMESTLGQYQLGGKEAQTKGPLVILLDSSGSMAGWPEIWSKAVAHTLITLAQRQGRAVDLLHFTTSVKRSDRFLGKKPSEQLALLDSLAAFYKGGTNWEKVLDAGADAIATHRKSRKADIVLITDGEFALTDSWVKLFKKKVARQQFSVHGVLIGDGALGVSGMINQQLLPLNPVEELSKVCDRIVTIPDLKRDADVDQIFKVAQQ